MSRALPNSCRPSASKPEIEVFNPGDIVLAHDLIKEGVLKGPQAFPDGAGGEVWRAGDDRDDRSAARDVAAGFRNGPASASAACSIR